MYNELTEIQEAVSLIRSRLKYSVGEEEWENHWWAHRYNPIEKRHLIVWPAGSTEECSSYHSAKWLFNYLHELVHAYLAESVHPFFGGFDFEYDNYPEEIVNNISEIHRYACDWFVWAEVIKLSPNAGYHEIKRVYRSVFPEDSYNNNENVELCTAALIYALACKHLVVTARTSDCHLGTSEGKHPSHFYGVVKIYLEMDPAGVSVDKLQNLINNFLALSCSYRVRRTDFALYPTWEVVEIYPPGSSSTIDNG